jgi:1-acylglycerone phosphate reductase
MALTQTFIPLLIPAQGLILNIGSVAAIAPYVFGAVYNASKAALHAYSRTLRLELEPFGVRVLVVVTGGVKSRIARTSRVLPEGSLYLEVNEHYQHRLTHSQEGAMDAHVYAKGVVDAALAGKTPRTLWRGNKAWLVWFVRQWLGSWAFDWVLPGMFGLDKLKALVRSRGRA